MLLVLHYYHVCFWIVCFWLDIFFKSISYNSSLHHKKKSEAFFSFAVLLHFQVPLAKHFFPSNTLFFVVDVFLYSHENKPSVVVFILGVHYLTVWILNMFFSIHLGSVFCSGTNLLVLCVQFVVTIYFFYFMAVKTVLS